MVLNQILFFTFCIGWTQMLAFPICNEGFPPLTPSEHEMPLCGNGKIDANEVCDDGNRRSNDGCNAWCSAFDSMTSTCTLAGKGQSCLYGKTVLGEGGHPAKSTFCSLRAFDIHPKGNYIVIADYSTILRMNLFTDQITTSLSVLNVNSLKQFSPICSINIFEDDTSFLVYECTSKDLEISLVSSTGFTRFSIASFEGIFIPSNVKTLPPPKIFIIPNSRDILIAGVSTNSSGNINTGLETCIEVYHFNVPTFQSFFNPSMPSFEKWTKHNMKPFVQIPCVVYNAVEQTMPNIKYKTYSLQGMIPKYIIYDECIHSHIWDSKCYVVYMERDDLHFLRAYIPEDGGYDIAYSVSTRRIMDNAQGMPMIRYGRNSLSNMRYSLQGACFTAQSQVSAPKSGIRPPVFSLGNICSNARSNDLDCSTPFNNPFITDVAMSPYLIPEGLNSFNTHWQLSEIFSNTVCDMSNHSNKVSEYSISGAIFYKKILEDVYGNTTPIDYAEIPNTQDIIYITQTSIGLIGTKQSILFDKQNKGYCRATDIIYCPENFFGSVAQGTCGLCNDTSSPGFGVSISWQIQCANTITPGSELSKLVPENIKNALHVAPSERYSTLTSKDIDEYHIYDAICTYLKSIGQNCPERKKSTLAPKQQFNAAADLQDSAVASINSQSSNLINCLIQHAERRLNINISNINDAEYISTWQSDGQNLLKISSANFAQLFSTSLSRSTLNNITFQNKTYTYNETKLLERCIYNNYMKLIKWLQCAIPFIINSTTISDGGRTQNRRRLLQSGSDVFVASRINENQGLTMISTTPVLYQVQESTTISTRDIEPEKESNSESFPFALGIGIGIAGVVVIAIIACILYNRKFKRN